MYRYDLVPASEGVILYNLYKDNLQKIPNGEVVGICGQTFPVYILSSNTQVLKLRKKRKVMMLPNFQPYSDEHKYSRILLYFPLKPGFSVNKESIGK